MYINNKYVKNMPIVLLALAVLMILVAQPYKNSAWMSRGTYLIFLCTAWVFVRRFTDLNKKIKYSELMFFLIAIGGVVAFIYAGSFSFGRIVPLLCFFELPILMVSVEKSNAVVKNIIYGVYFFLGIFYIRLSFSDKAHYYMGFYGESTVEELTLGFSNPNLTAMFLVFSLLVILIATSEIKRKILKSVFFAFSCVLLVLIYKTMSRAGLFIALIAIATVFLQRQKMVNSLLKKFAWIFPAVFFLFILLGREFYGDRLFMGEEFDTGRIMIYDRALSGFDNLPTLLFGKYSEFAGVNLHNTVVAILASYGIMTAISYLAFLKCKINEDFKLVENKSQETALFSFMLIILYSSVEAAFFISGSAYAVQVFSIYYLCLPEEEKEPKEALE